MPMARLSPSPSGSSRRLSELLEEQQEPFCLDLYLLDKGCSPALLDAAGGSCATCWPRSRRASPALTRRVAASRNRKTRASGILGLLLSKILHGTATATATAVDKKKKKKKKKRKKKLQPAAAIDWRVAVDREKTPGNLKNAVMSSPLRAVEACTDEAEEEEEDDDESSEQLSPVSVLEQRTFEQAPPAPHARKAMLFIRDLLDPASYKPASLDQLLDKHIINNFKDGRNHTSTTATTAALSPAPAPTRTNGATGATNWEEETFAAELAKVHDLVTSDMAGARAGAGGDDVRLGRWDVGAELAAAVLEALTGEIAVELVRMDRDDAIDNEERRPRPCRC